MQGPGDHLMNLFSFLLPHTRVPGAPHNPEALVCSYCRSCTSSDAIVLPHKTDPTCFASWALLACSVTVARHQQTKLYATPSQSHSCIST